MEPLRRIDWNELEFMVNNLASKLLKHPPSYLVGVSRGGIIPAAMLAQYFGPNIFIDTVIISVDYTKRQSSQVQKFEGFRKLPSLWRSASYQGHITEVLVIDDIADSGATINYLRNLSRPIKVACLFVTPRSKHLVDYYVEELPDPAPWIVFPWELE